MRLVQAYGLTLHPTQLDVEPIPAIEDHRRCRPEMTEVTSAIQRDPEPVCC